MIKQSPKPFVTIRAQRSPFRCNRALVATVVPIRILSIFDRSKGSPLGVSLPVNFPSRRRIHSRGASS